MRNYLPFKLILIIFCFFGNAQNNTIAVGEKLTFTASYSVSGLLTDIAEVVMQTNNVNTSSSTLLQLKCTASTYGNWDRTFKIRDLYESYVNPKTLTPYLHKRDIDEGGYYKFMQYQFNPKARTVKSLKRKRNSKGKYWEEKNNLTISADTRDLVSTLYNIRTLPIDQASPGDAKNFKILFDNEEQAARITYLGKEVINTIIGKKECYKLSLSLNNSDVLKGNDKNLLWLTADDNKIPVYAKFRIAVGSGELKLKSASGLKN